MASYSMNSNFTQTLHYGRGQRLTEEMTSLYSPMIEVAPSEYYVSRIWMVVNVSLVVTCVELLSITVPLGPGKLLLVGVRDFADLRPKNRQNPARFLWI